LPLASRFVAFEGKLRAEAGARPRPPEAEGARAVGLCSNAINKRRVFNARDVAPGGKPKAAVRPGVSRGPPLSLVAVAPLHAGLAAGRAGGGAVICGL
jgi:hypothetical protein